MASIKNLHPRPLCEVTCGPCAQCGRITKIELPTNEVIRWANGEHIQNIWPGMPSMTRETLISGVCSQECWDIIWGEEDDD